MSLTQFDGEIPLKPIKPIQVPCHDLDADLLTLARVLRVPRLSGRDRLRIVGHVLACMRVRQQLGAYGLAQRERDADFVRNLAMPTPN